MLVDITKQAVVLDLAVDLARRSRCCTAQIWCIATSRRETVMNFIVLEYSNHAPRVAFSSARCELAAGADRFRLVAHRQQQIGRGECCAHI